MRSVRGMELDARGGELTLNMDGEGRKKGIKKVNLNVKRSPCVRVYDTIRNGPGIDS